MEFVTCVGTAVSDKQSKVRNIGKIPGKLTL